MRLERLPLALAIGLALIAMPASSLGMKKSRKTARRAMTASDLVRPLSQTRFVLGSDQGYGFNKGKRVWIDEAHRDMWGAQIVFNKKPESDSLAWVHLGNLLVPRAAGKGADRARGSNKGQPKTAWDIMAQLQEQPFTFRGDHTNFSDGQQVWIKEMNPNLGSAGIARSADGRAVAWWIPLTDLEIAE
jgi:hypothetical protein